MPAASPPAPKSSASTIADTAPGSRKAAGSFWLAIDPVPPHIILLVERAVDALSAFSLPALRRPGTLILSTTGATSRIPHWIEIWQPKHILVAFDADDSAAQRLINQDPRATRLRPYNGYKDWNDILADA